ncbi:hypothetical protein J2Z21_008611 [Streptomyces griseochromogenes]|uniref:Transmembrane protein n=1 Tax=Streptomyces griseochromogenes TaxID=68214 RepID=A0A1B1B3D1_9ACTN|nr:hypothetical protein [Streptomyces griseochromogenes]ANP53335.1 hypothetical protein AVL59_30785 [Streptomyces griseochromogenes]MBP2055595.1 hypothetical protein [Streptomyces griseochromogenes]
MPLEPDAEQAARALEEVQRRRDQAIDAQRQPRWFSMAWGFYLFLVLSSPDLLPLLHLERWWMWWDGILGILTVVFLAGQFTRQGRGLLGLPPELLPQGIIPTGSTERRSPWTGLLVVVSVVGAVSVGSVAILSYVPGWHLLLGIAVGLAAMFPSKGRFERLKQLSQDGGRR